MLSIGGTAVAAVCDGSVSSNLNDSGLGGEVNKNEEEDIPASGSDFGGAVCNDSTGDETEETFPLISGLASDENSA
jgi:hypothetical protein